MAFVENEINPGCPRIRVTNRWSEKTFHSVQWPAVSLRLLTKHGNKQRRRVWQLEEYSVALVVDYTTTSEHDREFLAQL